MAHNLQNSNTDPLTAPSPPVLSIVVPCHNEEGSLIPLVNAIRETVRLLDLDFEIVIVDDFSTDKSWEILRSLGAEDPRVRGRRLAKNCGQSAALWAGIQAASGQFIATMDADLQNDPKDLPKFLEALKQHDCVCGSRAESRARGDGWIRRLSSKIANDVRNWFTRESVSDSACCYRVFRRECVSNLKFFKGMHRFLPTLIKMEGYRVTEIPVSHNARLNGKSHYGIRNRLFETSWDLFAIRWMQNRAFPYQVEERINFPTDNEQDLIPPSGTAQV